MNRGRSIPRHAWRYLLLMMFCLALSENAAAANSRVVTMQKPGTGRYTNTVHVGTQRYVYHKITVKKAGILQFTGASARGKGSARGILGRLVKADGKLKKETFYYTDKEKYLNVDQYQDAFYAVKKGTYYFRVSTSGMAGYTYRVKALFTPRIRQENQSRARAVTLRKGREHAGMFWFDGFSGIDTDTYAQQDWYRFRVSAGKPVRLWYWSNYHVPDLYFENGRTLQIRSAVKKKGTKKYTVYSYTPVRNGWQYIYIDNPAYEKLYALIVK